jgi:hypothetical protein
METAERAVELLRRNGFRHAAVFAGIAEQGPSSTAAGVQHMKFEIRVFPKKFDWKRIHKVMTSWAPLPIEPNANVVDGIEPGWA